MLSAFIRSGYRLTNVEIREWDREGRPQPEVLGRLNLERLAPVPVMSA